MITKYCIILVRNHKPRSMLIHLKLRSVVFFLLFSHSLFAQVEPLIKPGKVYPEDFDINSPLISSNTGAVIIADIGTSTLESYEYGWRISFKRLRRVKILD